MIRDQLQPSNKVNFLALIPGSKDSGQILGEIQRKNEVEESATDSQRERKAHESRT